MDDPKTTNWNPVLLITLNLLAAVLIISWIWSLTGYYWEAIDYSTFTFFNNSIKTGKEWQAFWAITNWRFFDTIQFVLIFSIAYIWIVEQNKKYANQRIMEFIFFILLCLFVNFILKIGLSIFDYRRLSPTKVIDSAFRLSKTATWLMTKDSSNTAFPGDHGFVLICASVFYWVKGGFRLGFVSSVLLTPFLFPRLVVGAHWLTDLLVGSIFISLITIGWYFGTPLQSTLPAAALKKLVSRFPKLNSVFK